MLYNQSASGRVSVTAREQAHTIPALRRSCQVGQHSGSPNVEWGAKPSLRSSDTLLRAVQLAHVWDVDVEEASLCCLAVSAWLNVEAEKGVCSVAGLFDWKMLD